MIKNGKIDHRYYQKIVIFTIVIIKNGNIHHCYYQNSNIHHRYDQKW
jgi:hypothetical protein